MGSPQRWPVRRLVRIIWMSSLLLLFLHPSYRQHAPFGFGLVSFISWLPSAAAQPPATSNTAPTPDCKISPAQSPPDGNEELQVEQDSATHWQPVDGTVRFTIKGNDLSPGKFQVIGCFRWLGEQNSAWRSTEPLQVVNATKAGEITFGATVPESLIDATSPDWLCDAVPSLGRRLTTFCGGRLHGQYDGLGFVPVAQMRIIAQGTGTWKALDFTMPVGVTHHWIALTIAAFFTVLAWWIVLKLARTRPAITGGPLIRVITNRNGYASLSQFQITLWTFAIAAGAIYVMALSGSLIDIPAEALTLLGISGLTVLGASLPGANASSSPPSQAAAVTTPGMISALTTVGVANDTCVVLSWRAPTLGTPAAAYTVEQKIGNQWTPMAGTPDLFLAITGLTANATSQFRVTAVDAQGTPGTASPPLSVLTPAVALAGAPGLPTNLAATIMDGAAGESGFTVSWSSPGGPLDGYLVRYRPFTGTAWIAAPGPIFGTSCPITGLTPNTAHLYQVAAVGNGAIGPWAQALAPVATRAHKPGYSDLIIWDGRNEVDVTRIQMLLFTVIAAAFVLLQIWRDSVIPAIPAGMLALMGISNGVYLTAKFIPPQR